MMTVTGDVSVVSRVQVSVHLGNWQQVLNYYSKAEATPEMTDVSNIMPLTTHPALTPSLSPHMHSLLKLSYQPT